MSTMQRNIFETLARGNTGRDPATELQCGLKVCRGKGVISFFTRENHLEIHKKISHADRKGEQQQKRKHKNTRVTNHRESRQGSRATKDHHEKGTSKPSCLQRDPKNSRSFRNCRRDLDAIARTISVSRIGTDRNEQTAAPFARQEETER